MPLEILSRATLEDHRDTEATLNQVPLINRLDDQQRSERLRDTGEIFKDLCLRELKDHHAEARKCKTVADAAEELKKKPPAESSLRNGDIIFQTHSTDEGKAIQLATKSPLDHCGILFKEGDEWFVYEAVQPVKKTPLKDFAKGGDDGKYCVRRLNNADKVLTDEALEKMHKFLKKNCGKDYDLKFEWSDDKLYCSELVWKAYREATGLSVGKMKKIGDYDLADPAVKKALEERYGKNIPLSEPTISPGNIFNSKKLKTVR